MTRSPANPRPVRTGRYRYSKLRWRLLVHALDAAGTVAMAAWRIVRPPPAITDPRRILDRPARPSGRLGAHQPADFPASPGLSGSHDRRSGLAEQPRGLRGRSGRQPRANRRADLVRAAPRPLGVAPRGLGAGPIDPRRGLRPGNRRPWRRAHRSGSGPGRHPAPGRLGDGRRRIPADRHCELGSRPPRGPLSAGTAGGAGDRRPTSPSGRSCMWTITTARTVARWLAEAWPRKHARRVEPPAAIIAGRGIDDHREHRSPAVQLASRHAMATGCTPAGSARFPLCWPCMSAPAHRPSGGPAATGTP